MDTRRSLSAGALGFPAAIVLAVTLLLPGGAAAQTAEEFFSGGSVDDVWVHINSRDWQLLRTQVQDSTFYPCDVEWRTLRVDNAACRLRGTGSRSGTKPGLDIHFDYYVRGQRFLGLSQLVLDNLWQDASMLQERLTMWLFQRSGVAAPREAHVRLFAGSAREFMGVYAVVEAIAPPFLQRAFGTPDAYLYEYRWLEPYQFEDLGSDLDPYALRFAARTHEFESAFSLYAPVRELIALFNEAPLDRIAESFDLESFIAQLAVENYVSDWDGLLGYAGLNNFYLSRQPGARARLIPWDKDFAFFDVALPPWHNFEFNVLARKVWADPVQVRAYLRCLLALADDGEATIEELERQYAAIAQIALADPLKPHSNEEFAAAVAHLRSFLRERPAIVRDYVYRLAPDLAR